MKKIMIEILVLGGNRGPLVAFAVTPTKMFMKKAAASPTIGKQ